jgi:cation diffusion facilitator CzcD-associated flavoprotein CzcO
MCTAIDLIRRNHTRDFVILEKGSHIGGTWNDNKYPGCCCDIWSHLYSYSFEPNPNWTRQYPGQEEIYAYLVGVAEKWGLYKHIRFNTSVEEASWDDEEGKWKVDVAVSGAKTAEYGANYTINADFLVSGVGQLNAPQYPSIEGLDSFKGKLMHSARWDWSYSLQGKRIGIIGNGATAAQIIPEVAKVAESLTVFQRTPNWIVPREDGPISPAVQTALKYIPGLRSRYRALLMDVREAMWETTIYNHEDGNQDMRNFCIDFMKKQLPNRQDLWEKLTPPYAPGCKRIIISDDFFPSLAQPHVHLETTPISKITEKGVVTKDGKEHEFDLLVLATGFKTLEFMYPIKIKGANGRSLNEIWKNGGRAYYGVSVEDLPNFGMLYGPNTNLGHNSIILMIEAQSRYINALIAPVLEARRKGKGIKIATNKQRVEEWNKELQDRLKTLTFADPNCQSWYKAADGTITNNWAGTVIEYQKALSRVEWKRDYVVEATGVSAQGTREVDLGERWYIGRTVEETVVPIVRLSLLAAAGATVAWAAKNRRIRQAIGV